MQTDMMMFRGFPTGIAGAADEESPESSKSDGICCSVKSMQEPSQGGVWTGRFGGLSGNFNFNLQSGGVYHPCVRYACFCVVWAR
jgi:hypothetical protein